LPSRAFGPGRCGLAGVGLEAGEDGVADLALEGSQRLFAGFPLGRFLVVVGTALGPTLVMLAAIVSGVTAVIFGFGLSTSLNRIQADLSHAAAEQV